MSIKLRINTRYRQTLLVILSTMARKRRLVSGIHVLPGYRTPCDDIIALGHYLVRFQVDFVRCKKNERRRRLTNQKHRPVNEEDASINTHTKK